MRKYPSIIIGGLIVLLVLMVFSFAPSLVNASPYLPINGLPNSSGFGYGVHVDPWGPQVEIGLQLVAHMNMDWVAADFDWAQLWPDVSQTPQMDKLDQFMNLAAELEIPVMLRLQHAPGWALGKNGPDPILTSALIVQLQNRYKNLIALELYSGANTVLGWGGSPDPSAYSALFRYVNSELKKTEHQLILIAAGLQPVQDIENGDMNDLDFLTGLYANGMAEMMPVVGLRMPVIESDLMELPLFEAPNVFRHYEIIRNIMLANNHVNGLLWITGFSWPDDLMDNPDLQAKWLQTAYQLAGSQLYIGAAIFNSLNPSQEVGSSSSLIGEDQSIHPGLERLVELVAIQNGNGDVTILSGYSIIKRMRSEYKSQKVVFK